MSLRSPQPFTHLWLTHMHDVVCREMYTKSPVPVRHFSPGTVFGTVFDSDFGSDFGSVF